jgi:transposase InsO family protein
LVENETGKRLKFLRSDNGSEYCIKEFDYYCSYHGIHREKIVPGTPQENGVSERMNRTIMERERSMRLHAGFPLQFWADVVDTVVYLINRGPSSSLDGRISEET